MTVVTSSIARLGIVGALVASVTASAVSAQQAATEPRPWSARPSTVVVTEQRAFRNKDVELKGTLYIPQGGRHLGAVVVTHGASSPLRTSPLYRHLIQMLPPLGVAVFVYDRRGTGQSTGSAKDNGFDVLADDSIAAVRMLKTDSRIDQSRIGIWGLSQGGWLSLPAASRSAEVSFVISISAPVVTPDVQMIFSSTNTLRVNGYSQADIDQMVATRKAVDDYMRGTGGRAEAQRLVDVARTKPWYKYLYMGETISDRATSGWRREIEHDPLQTLEAVKVPALIIYGATDPVVPVETSVKRLAKLAKTHRNLDVAVVAGADHGMQTTVSAKDLLDPAHADDEKPDAPEYFAVLSSWLTAQGVAHSGLSKR